MSSMRNAAPRRPHRERAQPTERSKWGLLEKHKDYKLRAQDYNKKKKALRALRQKATERNPDEFSFKMMSTKTSNGIRLGDRGNKTLSHNVVKLLKTQDAGYLRTTLQRVRLERERAEEAFQIMGDFGRSNESNNPDHEDLRIRSLRPLKDARSSQDMQTIQRGEKVVFVDDANEQLERGSSSMGARVAGSGSAQDEDEAFTGQSFKATNGHDLDEATVEDRSKERERQLRKLESLREQEEELIVAEQEMGYQRARMNNALGGTTKAGVRFKMKERKR